MKNSQTEKLVKAFGLFLTLLAMPFMGIVYGMICFCVNIYSICLNCGEGICHFFDDTWRSAFAPAYCASIPNAFLPEIKKNIGFISVYYL